MKEVVDRIIKEEKEARVRVENARNQAGKIMADAEEETRKLKEEAKARVKDETKKIIEKANADVQAEKEQIIQKAIRQARTIKEEKAKDIKKAVELAFQRVIG